MRVAVTFRHGIYACGKYRAKPYPKIALTHRFTLHFGFADSFGVFLTLAFALAAVAFGAAIKREALVVARCGERVTARVLDVVPTVDVVSDFMPMQQGTHGRGKVGG